MASLVKGDPKAPFLIATRPKCRGGCHSIPWIAPLYPWSLPYNPKSHAGRNQVPFFEFLAWLDLGLMKVSKKSKHKCCTFFCTFLTWIKVPCQSWWQRSLFIPLIRNEEYIYYTSGERTHIWNVLAVQRMWEKVKELGV